jgi:hypothetical protein
MEVGMEQEASSIPHETSNTGKNLFTRIVSFIVQKTRRIVAKGVVQSNRSLPLYLPFSSFYCWLPESGNQEC